jgi:hypothetical protein
MKPSLCDPSPILQADVFPALTPRIGKNFRWLHHATCSGLTPKGETILLVL